MNSREAHSVGICCKGCFRRESKRHKIVYKKMLRSLYKRRLLKDLKNY